MAVRFLMNDINLPKVQPMLCGRRQCPPGWHIRRRDTIAYTMHFVISGTGTFYKNSNIIPVRAGDLFICGPGEMGEYAASQDTPYDYIWVKLDCAKELRPYLQKDVIHIPEASRIFIQIADAADDPGKYFRVYGLLYQFFGILLSKDKVCVPATDYAGQAIAYIQDNYASAIRIADLAEVVGLDRSYFCRLFRKQTGLSPQEYIVAYRLEKAKELLEESSLRQKEICRLVGYRDVYTFSRMFRRKYGIAPGKFRNSSEHYLQDE